MIYVARYLCSKSPARYALALLKCAIPPYACRVAR